MDAEFQAYLDDLGREIETWSPETKADLYRLAEIVRDSLMKLPSSERDRIMRDWELRHLRRPFEESRLG